ncbi:hypothetical protein, partial [Mycoplasma capricolum]|uniref:hypothetical protein n=1 Tax=Mycoplasma capricolum TaxID=2095 RepID=UPI0034DB7799
AKDKKDTEAEKKATAEVKKVEQELKTAREKLVELKKTSNQPVVAHLTSDNSLGIDFGWDSYTLDL